MSRKARIYILNLVAVTLLVLPCVLTAAPPDLTGAGVIEALKTDGSASPVYAQTYNLGATGLRGWIHIGGGSPYDGTLTVDSRQILVTVASTPGSAVMAVDDVILGAMAGSSGTVPVFTNDARKAFGAAIGDAEKTGAGTLRVKRWRSGVIDDVNIPMAIMGDYAGTAPYACPKSAMILSNACNKLVSQLIADSNFLSVDYAGAINGLALLAGVAPDHPDYATVQTRLQTFARSCASSMSLINGRSTWNLGYAGLFLSEYYLATGDSQVVSGLNNYIVTLARMQSRYGTYGHSGSLLKDDGSLHGTVPPYGPVNGCSIPANLAIVMGKKALLAAGQPLDPEINPAIQRGSDFYGWFANKGGIPYGEHEPFLDAHSIAGKDAMCALMFAIQDDRTMETEHFTRFTLASFDGLEYAHAGGQNFSFLWHAMGANVGGELAAAEYMKKLRWHHDLVRRTDGSFAFEGQEQFGAGSTVDGTYLGESRGYDFQTTASYILTYSLPLKRLYITGKNANPIHTLDAAKVTNALDAASFKRDCPGFTTTQLIAGLSEFDPVVRHAAAIELATRSLSAGELTTLRGMVTAPDANGRMGACQALGLLNDAAALPSIVQRLDRAIESNSWVRAKAASAIRSYPPETVSTYRDAMLAAYAANATDPEVIVWDDPVQISNNYLSFALFGDAVYYGNTIASYTINAPRHLLYPAVKAGLKQPDSNPRTGVASFCKNYLTLQDVQALALDIFEVTTTKSQADTMWSMEPQLNGLELLMKYNCSEALPIALSLMDVKDGWAWAAAGFLSQILDKLATFGDSARWIIPHLNEDINTLFPVLNPVDYNPTVPKILSTISTIDSAITSPGALIHLLPLASNQVVSTTGTKAITLTGGSCRTNQVTVINVSEPAFGVITGTVPNLVYTPFPGYTGPDAFTFEVVDNLTTSAPGTVSIIVGSAGSGLNGEYYDNIDFTSLRLARTNEQVNFDWGTGSPDALIGADTFSVCWNGVLLVPETGRYTFSTLNSDGVRLYVDGVLVVDDFIDQATNWKDGNAIVLTAGQKVEMLMEYYENTGSAVAKLKWAGPSFAGLNGTLIGKEWLYDGMESSNRTPYAYAQSVTVTKNTAKDITLRGSGVISTPLTYSVVTQPTNGTLSGTAPNLTYTPSTDITGTDSFTFTVNNGTSDATPATVSIGIQSAEPVAFTWLNPASGNMSVAGNWTSGSAPVSNGQPYYTLNFTTSGTYTVTHDLNNGFQLNRLNMAGEVTLAGANSLAFAINGFLLPQFNQNSSATVTLDAPLQLDATTTLGGSGAGQVTLNGQLTGSGGLVVDIPGQLWLWNMANTYSGGTVINDGTVVCPSGDGNPTPIFGSGPVTINAGARLSVDRNEFTNSITLGAATITGGNSFPTILSGPVTLTDIFRMDLGSSGKFEISGNICGSGGVESIGTTSWILNGTNTYTGSTTIKAGAIQYDKPVSVAPGRLNIHDGAVADLNYIGTRTIHWLTLGGVDMPAGVYGSLTSSAEKKDSHLAGNGTVTLMPVTGSITNQPASMIAATTATLNAALTGNDAPYTVVAYWNTIDAGTNALAWTNAVSVGSWAVQGRTNISCSVTGLVSNTKYYFTFLATNAIQELWATNILSFVTAPVSANAFLASLEPSAGTLNPAFDFFTTHYTATVNYAVSSVTVTPTAVDAHATIKINGSVVASGMPSSAFALAVGSTNIETTVVSRDQSVTNTYSLVVTRNPSSTNAMLASLVPSAGALNPAFSSDTLNYAMTVPYATPSLTVTPTGMDGYATLTVNGSSMASGEESGAISLNVGSNLVTTVVTAQDGTTVRTYTLTVTRTVPNSDATLASLVPSAGAFIPVFASNHFSYTESVAYTTPSLALTPTASAMGAQITVNGASISSGGTSALIGLAVGTNAINTVVISEDLLTTNTYSVAVVRAASTTLRWDANGATAGFTDGAGAWLNTDKWWDGLTNTNWFDGADALLGNGSAGGAVTLAAPATCNSLTVSNFTGTYTLGSAGNRITINSGMIKNSGSGALTFVSPITLGGAQAWVNNSAGAITTASGTNLVDNNGHYLTVDGTGTMSFGVINNPAVTLQGAGNLVKNGVGRLNVGGTNTSFTGSVTLNGGVLQGYNGADVLGNGNVTLNGGVLSFFWGLTYTRSLGVGTNQVQVLDGESGFGGAGTTGPTINLGSNVVWGALGEGAATGYFNPGKFVLGDVGTSNAGIMTFSSAIDLNGVTRTILVPKGLSAGGNVSTISGAITNTGTAGLIKEGDGTLVLSATNTYIGDATISGGNLRIGHNTAGTLAGGNYAGNISIASGANLQIWSTAAQTLSGTISGEGGLHKAYGGALTLSGTNTYSGRTSFLPQTAVGCTVNISSFNSVNGGSPLMAGSSLGAPTNVANGTIDIGEPTKQAGVTLNYTNGPGETTDRVINFGFSGSASHTLKTSGTGLLKFTRPMTANAVTTQSGKLILDGTGNGEITEALPNLPSGGLSKNGAGSWVLGGANTYTGATAITAGKLFINGDQSSATGSVTVSASATLGGSGIIGGNVTVTNNGRLEFDISTDPASHDRLEIATGKGLTFTGASVLTITSSGGGDTGTYTLVSGGTNIIGVAPATVNLPTNWVGTVSISSNNLLLNVISTQVPQYAFTVFSAHGAPNPAGTNWYEHGTTVNFAMTDSRVIVPNDSKLDAIGWVGTGSLISGTSTNGSFTITNNTTMTWQWQTNYWINLNVITD